MSEKRIPHDLQTKLCKQIIDQQYYLQSLYLYLTAENGDIEHALNTLTNLLIKEYQREDLLKTITEIAEYHGYSKEENVYGINYFKLVEEVEA